MLDLVEREHKEKSNRKRIFKIIEQIPEGVPIGWESRTLAVGGLTYIGFSEIHPEHLVCISSQGQSLIDCATGEKRYVEELYDEDDLIAYSDGIDSEKVCIAGEGGGGLRHYSKAGNILEQISPIWPTQKLFSCQIIAHGGFLQKNVSLYSMGMRSKHTALTKAEIFL